MSQLPWSRLVRLNCTACPTFHCYLSKVRITIQQHHIRMWSLQNGNTLLHCMAGHSLNVSLYMNCSYHPGNAARVSKSCNQKITQLRKIFENPHKFWTNERKTGILALVNKLLTWFYAICEVGFCAKCSIRAF